MFSQARRVQAREEENLKIVKMRQTMFDKNMELVQRYLAANLVELLYENKRIFAKVYTSKKQGP
jgi:hypothetical protein